MLPLLLDNLKALLKTQNKTHGGNLIRQRQNLQSSVRAVCQSWVEDALSVEGVFECQ